MYDPEYFKMPGDQILEVINHVEVGDVILRGYDGYADGYFIPCSEGHGRYSHAGMYTGNGMVTHAVSPNVEQIHVLEFMECDRIAVLRPKSGVAQAVAKAEAYFEKKVGYDFSFSEGDEALYCFELCAECYSCLGIPRKDAKALGGLVQRKQCYLASSFFESDGFELVYECNPANGILVDNFQHAQHAAE